MRVPQAFFHQRGVPCYPHWTSYIVEHPKPDHNEHPLSAPSLFLCSPLPFPSFCSSAVATINHGAIPARPLHSFNGGHALTLLRFWLLLAASEAASHTVPFITSAYSTNLLSGRAGDEATQVQQISELRASLALPKKRSRVKA